MGRHTIDFRELVDRYKVNFQGCKIQKIGFRNTQPDRHMINSMGMYRQTQYLFQ
jgi:hypothetical protein